jgi:hypothetical protein
MHKLQTPLALILLLNQPILFSGLKLPVKGALPLKILVAALIEKQVLV